MSNLAQDHSCAFSWLMDHAVWCMRRAQAVYAGPQVIDTSRSSVKNTTPYVPLSKSIVGLLIPLSSSEITHERVLHLPVWTQASKDLGKRNPDASCCIMAKLRDSANGHYFSSGHAGDACLCMFLEITMYCIWVPDSCDWKI